ncbi:DUF4468 domain-containing protein [Flavobacterium sp.]|uniref:DUF4468 domain-containing protein n=1 Tax=Flavobacterium sp. TaxID=239 RepID=UPI003753A7D5
MKKTITILAMMISILSFSQEAKFKFTQDGLTDYVITECKDKSAGELYKKTIDWINVNYTNPNEVIKAKVENEMIRIDGFGKSAFSRTFSDGTKADYDVTYTMEFQFQDGKYRIKYTHKGITVDNSEVFFKITDVINNIQDKNGNGWNNAKEQYQGFVQLQIDSLFNYITKKNNGW